MDQILNVPLLELLKQALKKQDGKKVFALEWVEFPGLQVKMGNLRQKVRLWSVGSVKIKIEPAAWEAVVKGLLQY